MSPLAQAALTVLLVGLALFAISHSKKSKAQKVVERNTVSIPSGWWHLGHDMIPSKVGVEVLPDGSLRINVPVGKVIPPLSTVVDGTPRRLTAGAAVVSRGTVTGGPIVSDDRSQEPTYCHFMIRKNADLMNPNHRWYSQGKVELKGGEFVLTSKLTADTWINRDGKKNEVEFNATLNDLGAIGGAFGAERGRAHGDYALEPAEIAVKLETVG